MPAATHRGSATLAVVAPATTSRRKIRGVTDLLSNCRSPCREAVVSTDRFRDVFVVRRLQVAAQPPVASGTAGLGQRRDEFAFLRLVRHPPPHPSSPESGASFSIARRDDFQSLVFSYCLHSNHGATMCCCCLRAGPSDARRSATTSGRTVSDMQVIAGHEGNPVRGKTGGGAPRSTGACRRGLISRTTQSAFRALFGQASSSVFSAARSRSTQARSAAKFSAVIAAGRNSVSTSSQPSPLAMTRIGT